ncbi:MAG TPA: type II methionyl aminopeptidase [Candidatus Methanoperedenaceae archaeon]|nr:type II methionyl aminopeptidase [Candidatus Methanoperedenaceae archaeon]
MNAEMLDCYRRAGKIAATARNEAAGRVIPGASMLDLAVFVEARIADLGGKPAFPCNISVNDVASHYTPFDHEETFKEGDVVKLDIGAHVNGYLADTAITIEAGSDRCGRLIGAVELALENAVSSVRTGALTSDIGGTIEDTLTEKGFQPLKQLTGHSLGQYDLHSGVSIPNYSSGSRQRLKTDDVVAIEPFATAGNNKITYGKPLIFRVLKGAYMNDVTEDLRRRFCHLPFAGRWVPGIDLARIRNLGEYPVLLNRFAGAVAQAEHTVIVHEEGCEVITR